MAIVKPFQGMRYSDKVVIKDVVSPPYDIIPPSQQEELYQRSAYNVIRLEYGKEEAGDNESNNKYSRAGAYLHDWLKEGILKIEDKPAFYVYQQDFKLPNGMEKSLRGIVCLVKLEEFSKGIILPHEETLSKAKTDRFSLMSATNCNFSQIYSLYIDPQREIASTIDQAVSGEPVSAFASDEGIMQKLWLITDETKMEQICKAFMDKQLFIADGHHRYETALNYYKSSGIKESEYVMMFLVDMDHDGLAVFPTHRMLSDLENFQEQEILQKLNENFITEKIEIISNAETEIERVLASYQEATFAFYTGKSYFYRITLKSKEAMQQALPYKSDAYRGLDVSVLHTLILDKIMGIDMENMANQKNLTYTKILSEAIDEVKKGNQQCSFILNATKVYEIKDVSLAGEKMPQKSTYFWPKLITGLVMNYFGKES